MFDPLVLGELHKISKPPIVGVTGNKTLALTDAGTMQKVTAASVITIPQNSSVAFDVGTEIGILSYTASNVEIAPGSNVTLYSASGYKKISGQYASATLKKMATDEWVLFGSLKA